VFTLFPLISTDFYFFTTKGQTPRSDPRAIGDCVRRRPIQPEKHEDWACAGGADRYSGSTFFDESPDAVAFYFGCIVSACGQNNQTEL
jgi:hypothetical protein